MSLENQPVGGEVEGAQEKAPMSIAEAAQYLNVDAFEASKNPALLVEAYDALRAQDKGETWGSPETNILEELAIPVEVDRLVEDIRRG